MIYLRIANVIYSRIANVIFLLCKLICSLRERKINVTFILINEKLKIYCRAGALLPPKHRAKFDVMSVILRIVSFSF